MTRVFEPKEINNLFQPEDDSSGEDNGQVTIIGGSKLFHGALLLSLKVASRIVDMVFFASPVPSVGRVAEHIRSELMSFIWVPWDEVDAYIEKSDAVLMGPGLMRFSSEQRAENKGQNVNFDEEGKKTREITERLLKKFPNKKWVVDAGSLQVMDTGWIPKGAVLTPNVKEFYLLFGDEADMNIGNTEGAEITESTEKSNTPVSTSATGQAEDTEALKNTEGTEKIVGEMAKKYSCTIVMKGPETIVCSPSECVVVKGGNAGLTKGGTGDCLAGLTVALLAKNEPFLAASCASYIAKKAADELFEKVGTNYNADDLADKIPETLWNLTKH